MNIELYKFVVGNERYLHTTAQQPVTYQSEEYAPTYIRRGSLKGTTELARQSLKIRLPRDAPIATRFAGGPPTAVTEVEIYAQDDAATALVYLGRVLTIARQGSEAHADCEPIYTSMRQAGLRRHYQKQCPHTLYDAQCRADRAAFRVDATLSAVNGVEWSATAFGNKPDGWFTGGDIEWGTLPERRAIVAHTGDTITLASALAEAAAGDDVAAFAGCDHSFATCRDKFANEVNYGGMPYIPRKNPFGSDPIF